MCCIVSGFITCLLRVEFCCVLLYTNSGRTGMMCVKVTISSVTFVEIRMHVYFFYIIGNPSLLGLLC
jgi:hypothetical protein